MNSLIILSDGTELSSGVGTVNALQSVTVTHATNDSQDLTVGSTCASMMEATIISPGGGLSLAAGDEITLYKEVDLSTVKIGVYRLEKPTKASANTMKITAFDRVARLDKDLSVWLSQLSAWPYTVLELANLVCEECGVTLENEELPNGDFYVQKFTADGVTGRQIMQWIGQAAGRFCIATPDGNLKFDWYKENTKTIGGDYWYYQGGLKFEDYSVERIAKVQIRQNSEDIGTSYPDTTGNTYVIEANPLLVAVDKDTLIPVAQTLYEQLKDVAYTPCSITIPANLEINAGDIVSVTDVNGETFKAYIMTKRNTGGKDTLECTGSANRESPLTVNNQTIKQFYGRVLNLQMSVEGVKVENKDINDNLASIRLEIGEIASEVATNRQTAEGLRRDMTLLQQNADSFEISIQNIIQNGVDQVTTKTGYKFNADGLEIAKTGEQMKNKLDNTGMVVSRSGTVMLSATADGVQATDVKVNNYLIVGDHCRFEDYSNGKDSRRTACFFTG